MYKNYLVLCGVPRLDVDAIDACLSQWAAGQVLVCFILASIGAPFADFSVVSEALA
jgi:hypothetical protein